MECVSCLVGARKQLPCLAAGMKVSLVASITFLTVSTAIASEAESTASRKSARN